MTKWQAICKAVYFQIRAEKACNRKNYLMHFIYKKISRYYEAQEKVL